MITLRCSLAFHLNFIIQVQVTLTICAVQGQVVNWTWGMKIKVAYMHLKQLKATWDFLPQLLPVLIESQHWLHRNPHPGWICAHQAVCWGDAFNSCVYHNATLLNKHCVKCITSTQLCQICNWMLSKRLIICTENCLSETSASFIKFWCLPWISHNSHDRL